MSVKLKNSTAKVQALLRVAALEQQVLQAKQQRDTDAANLNFAIQTRQQSTQNLAPFNSNLSQSISS